MAAIDAVYWNKCVSKVMKEAKQYLVYDGIDETADEIIPETSGEEAVTSNESEVATTSNLNTKSQLKALKALVVKKCTQDLISPTELSTQHGKSKRTIQYWVTSSGADLPHNYKKRKNEFSNPIDSKPSYSNSSSDTTFGDHSYTRTDFRLPPAKRHKSDSNSTGVMASKTPITLHCPKCSFETSRKSSLDIHINSHIDCVHCGQTFAGKTLMDVHLKTHKPKKQYLCDFCRMDCKYRQSKWRHMKICEKKK